MKNLKFFALAALATVAVMAGCKKDKEKEATPDIKSSVPEVEATEGAYTVVWNAVDYAECNGLVFAGNYNDWSTDVEQMAKFEKIEGYTNWYKAVIVPASEITQLEGKPCALAGDGTFPSSWDHQWIGSEEKPCELVKGEASFEVEYSTETKMIVPTIGGVVYVRSYQFKVDPCVEEQVYDVTFNLSVEQEVDEAVKVYVVGDFVENGWTLDAYEMTRVDNKTFKIEGIKAKIGREYKYTANATWNNEMVIAAPSEGDTCSAKLEGNWKIADVTVNDKIYGFNGINGKLCPEEEEKPEAVAGVMYIKCEAEGWTWKQMTKAEDKEVYTFTTTLKDGFTQLGANIYTVAVDDGAAWYPLDNTLELVAGDKVIYTYDATVDPATLTIAKAE